MRLIHFLGSTSVHAHFEQIIPEFTLYKLAEIVDVIKLSGSGRFRFRRDGNLCSFGLAYDILRKRCSYLDVSDTNLQFASREGRSLSDMLIFESGMHSKPFYFAARGSNELSLEVWHQYFIKTSPDSSGKSMIEVRHKSMERR